MAIPREIQKPFTKINTDWLVTAASTMAQSQTLRKQFIKIMEKEVREARSDLDIGVCRPPGVTEDRFIFSQAIWKTGERILEHDLAKPVIKNLARNIINGIMIENGDQSIIAQFNTKHGINPPSFLVLSPGKACNLKCTGCYASCGDDSENMDWDVLDRIIREAKELWGVRFITISGGEPLAYRSKGKTILDIAEKHNDIFFLMYSNGTLIDDRMSNRLAEIGNITPAISLEGWKERTDERRGEGVYDKIIEAMHRMRRDGVPFGISLTATRYNVEELFSDDFIEYFFDIMGALYGWSFQYMPIGRSYTLDLMPTIEQRLYMWQRSWEFIRQQKVFLADFWNHGTLVDGCMAAGRGNGGGYLYIDWSGKISPCVFVPYSPVNIYDIYANGKDLNDVWEEPFFSGIRKWQEDYRTEDGNLLAPCIIRDHHGELRKLIAKHEPDPMDESARSALLDKDYAEGLTEYGTAYREYTDPLWQDIYLNEGMRSKGFELSIEKG